MKGVELLGEELLLMIEALEIETSRMTCDEIGKATGASPQLVKKTLNKNALPYISERLSPKSNVPRLQELTEARETQKRGRTESMELLQNRQLKKRNGVDWATSKILDLGNATRSMTIAEIGAATGLSYLETHRVLSKQDIKHL